jgi:hypothetical protein
MSDTPMTLRVNLASSPKWGTTKLACPHCGMSEMRKGFVETADGAMWLGIWVCDCYPAAEDEFWVKPLTRLVQDSQLGDPSARWKNIRLSKRMRDRLCKLALLEAEHMRQQTNPREKHASFTVITLLRLISECKL